MNIPNTSDAKDVTSLDVYKGEHLCGRLSRSANTASFTYDRKYLERFAEPDLTANLAYNMPLSKKPLLQRGVNLHPFFAGLLPEGQWLTAIVRKIKTSQDDLFSILVAAGHDCVGDVSVVLEGQSHLEDATDDIIVDAKNVVFHEYFKNRILSSAWHSTTKEPALPGIQPKISAGRISFPIKLSNQAPQYILKLAGTETPYIVENEHFFMQVARQCGLDVASNLIVEDKNGIRGLLVKRFDRVLLKAPSKLQKIHQEDACQFLQRFPADKYRLTFSQITDTIQHLASAPLVETERCLRGLAFSYVIANGDLHGKNISLATNLQDQRVMLTPWYDLLSTLPYGDSSMALEFEGRKDNIKRNDFINFGKRYGLRRAVVISMLDQIYEGVRAALVRLPEIGFGARKSQHLRQVIEKRLADIGEA